MSSKNNDSACNANGSATSGFDSSEVPYPSKSEIQEAWGGRKNFMESYGLKVWNDDDVKEADAIVKVMQDAEYEERVAAAREEYEKRAR